MKKQLFQYVEDCTRDLNKLGYNIGYIPAKFNDRKGVVGICNRKNGEFSIEINRTFFMNESEKEVKSTVYHELIHTIPGCWNHGGLWKSIADMVNKTYDADIKEIYSNKKLFEDEYKYIVMCPNCGIVAKFFRKSNRLKNISEYHCGKCGCKGLIVKENL